MQSYFSDVYAYATLWDYGTLAANKVISERVKNSLIAYYVGMKAHYLAATYPLTYISPHYICSMQPNPHRPLPEHPKSSNHL